MNKAFFSVAALAVFGAAIAQSNFTIVRPADGSTVREKVRILFPKSSIPANGYVGIYVNNKFLEAVMPIPGAQNSYYELDTKKKGIPDGEVNVEAVLFADFSDRPRIISRSSVNVKVANSASIPVPANGFTLRYRFRPGTQWVYRVESRTATNNLSEALAGTVNSDSLLAGTDADVVRLLYSVDNSYGNGDGLLRLQALPNKGKDSAVFTPIGSGRARFMDYQMAPIYMRVQGTGMEVFGSIPRYFPLSGTAGEVSRTDLYAAFPLPTLPARPQRPGDTWRSRFQLGSLDLEKAAEVDSVTTKGMLPARAEFLGVEWEMGHPCARIRHTFAVRDSSELRNNPGNANSMIVNATKIEEDIYFALDLGTVVKMVREYTIDVRELAPAAGAGARGPGAAGGGAGPSVSGSTGLGGGGSQGPVGNNRIGPGGEPVIDIRQALPGGRRGGQPGMPGGRPPAGGPPGQGRGPAGIGAPGRGAAGGTRAGGGGNVARINRVTVQMSFVLEK